MIYKFLKYSDIESYFKSGDLNIIKKMMEDCFLICSVSDMLYISEQFKKNNIKTTISELNSNFEMLVREDQIYFPEIDRENLLDNLFDIEERDINLWEKACSMKISPRFSISLIAIRLNESSFWTEETFNEMEEYYLSLE